MPTKQWKIEQYTVDVLPAITQSLQEYGSLPLRESVISTSAILDAALAELIQRRLTGPDHEIVEFLGADEDGRAPCGSFGSRIQLARLLGLIVDEDVDLLRRVKKLRNIAAHRVKLNDGRVKDALLGIWELLQHPVGTLVTCSVRLLSGDTATLEWLAKHYPMSDIEKSQRLLRDTVAELRASQSWNWLFELNVEPRSLPYIYVIYVPKLLREDAQMGSLLLSLLIGMYKGRFDLLFETVRPVDALRLPRRAVKMWPSDQIEQTQRERG